MAKIFAPNTQYTGISAGVAFANGVGECDDPERLKWFERSGYTVETEPETPKVEADATEPVGKAPDAGDAAPKVADADAKKPSKAEK
ncbi:hypothetical protein [Paenibacillus sp. NFR01]|uniref:hypothetical protein n=1 Tax=Paenibacillus sp. NFR01 TaxID=1566279 RepID=UPI0008D65269|nr:hypothetical protein [Paenibacillus sp. NFR01]SEU32704.1 hypothetical protein SAMN03159358_0145 [Paenibacillus sp. NFR01]